MIEPGEIDTRAPYEGESLYGFVADVTGANQLGRVAEIAGAADRLHGHRPQLATQGWDDLPILAALLEVEVGELQLRSYPIDPNDAGRRAFFGTSVARADISMRVRKFSPAALAKAPYHRGMWQLRIPFDVETCEILISTCPLCHRIQRWRHSAGVAFCDGCGESLEQPAKTIDQSLKDVLNAAIGLTHTDPARREQSLEMLPAEVAYLGPAMAFELLLRLVPVAAPSCSWRSSDRIWHNDPHHIAHGLSDAWHLLAGWPNTVTARISRDLTTATRYADGTGGATRRFLKLRHSESVPLAVRQMIGRLHELIDTAGPFAADLKSRIMTGKEVAKSMGTGTQEVAALRRLGAFQTIGVARGAMLLPAFDRTEISQIVRDLHRRLDLNRVSARLGLPYYAIEGLCARGRLSVLTHPFFQTRFAKPQTLRESADLLIDALTSGNVPHLDGAHRILNLMQIVGGRLKPWDAVIEAMLDRRFRYVVDRGAEPLFQRVRARIEDILPYLKSPIVRDRADSPLMPHERGSFVFATMMTKRDASEVLNLAPREGTLVLKAYPTLSYPSIPLSDVLSLAKLFVTNVEIAAGLDVPYQLVRRAAADAGISRACDAGYDRTMTTKIVEATIALSSELRRTRSLSDRALP